MHCKMLVFIWVCAVGSIKRNFEVAIFVNRNADGYKICLCTHGISLSGRISSCTLGGFVLEVGCAVIDRMLEPIRNRSL